MASLKDRTFFFSFFKGNFPISTLNVDLIVDYTRFLKLVKENQQGYCLGLKTCLRKLAYIKFSQLSDDPKSFLEDVQSQEWRSCSQRQASSAELEYSNVAAP